MANTLKFGNGEWYGKKDTILAYNDLNSNYKPLPFNFSRASKATVVNKDGLIEEVGSGQPRIDYKDDSEGALLLEPSRTNFLTYSEDFSNNSYTKTNVTVTSGFLAPNGSTNATKLVSSAVNGQLLFGGGSGNTNTKSVSVFAKANTSTSKFKIIEQYYSGHQTLFDLNLGVVEFNNSVGSKIEDYGNGWYKCTHIQSYTSGQTNATFAFRTNTPESLFIWGAQLEVGSYATSYIPTQGSTVTRLVDDMPNHLNINPLNIGNSYTLFLNADLNKVVNNKVFCEIENSASNDVFSIRINNGGKVRVYNALDSAYPTSSLESNTNKWAIRIDGNSYKIFGANSSRSGTLATARNIGEIKFYGIFADLKINNFNIYNTALSDTECQALVN